MSSAIADLLDLPKAVQKSQFVVSLESGVANPASVVEHYAVTEQIHDAYDQALGFVKLAIEEHQNVASYLHGSFGSGKSHFMALLSLMLANDSRAFGNEALHDLRAEHEWLRDKKILRLHFNMIDASSLEDRIFKGYLAHLAQHHPDAPLPAIFRDAGLFENADALRDTLGDDAFFAKLNQGKQASSKWGSLQTAQAWDAERFARVLGSSDETERARLLTDLTRTHFPAFAQGNQGFVDFEPGLAALCGHARRVLGMDAIVLFLDELILWLGSIAADRARLNREVPKLSRLVERNLAGDETPVVTFAARQRDISEMVGQELVGPEHEHVRNALAHWHGRFNQIQLGDKNLPEIVQKRVVRAKSDEARKTLDQAFEKLRAQLKGNAYETLLGADGDERAFRRVYPFSPALIETLVALSHLLQRERTALKVLHELLIEHLPAHMPDFQLGQVIPVGELWDVLAAGEEPLDGAMRERFRQARRLYEHHLLPVLQAQPSDSPRADQRLIKTLLLAALVPNVAALRDLTVRRLVQLNHGSLRTIIPGAEIQKASTQLRQWAAMIHNLRVGEGEDPSVSLAIDDLDVTSIIENAKNFNTEGARKAKLRGILFEALGLESERDDFEHKLVWRGSKRVGSVLYGNVREMDDVQLQAPSEHDFRVVIDYPFDRAGHAPSEDEKRVLSFLESGKPTPTVVWIPSFFGERIQRALGELVVIDRILEGDNAKQHMSNLREEDQRRARTALQHLGNQKRGQVSKTLAVAYGLRAPQDAAEGDLDDARAIDRHFFSLYPDCALRAPARSELGRAIEAAVSELMDARFPRHPAFDPGDRTVTVAQLEKAFAAYERVCAQPDQRLPVAKRELGEYALPERLGMLDVSEASARVRPLFAQEIDKELKARGLESPTVRQVKNVLDPDGKRGLAEEVRDFEVLCYALVSNRELTRDGRPVTDAKLGKLGPDWELIKAPLPAMAKWSDAVERAGTLFGVTVSRALNVNNLRLFSQSLQAAVQRALQAKAHEIADVLAARSQTFAAVGPRLESARAVAELLAALGTRDPVAQVNALADCEPRSSLTAMQKHLAAATDTLRVLHDDMRFDAFAALREREDAESRGVLEQVRAVLQSDEVTEPLATKLNRLGLQAQQLITGKRAEPSRAGGGIVAAGAKRGVHGADLPAVIAAVRSEIERALETGGQDARVSIEWKVEKD